MREDYFVLPLTHDIEDEKLTKQMKDYGYEAEGMYPIPTRKMAMYMFQHDIPIMLLHCDNTEAYAESEVQIYYFEGMYGVEKDVWNQKKEEMQQIENQLEVDLMTGEEDVYGLYQLKSTDNLHYHRFESMESLSKHGLSIEKDNYVLTYVGKMEEGLSLEGIYRKFNLDHPTDYQGHSLSISDIVVLHKNGKNEAHYVNDIGYREVPEFVLSEQMMKKSRKVR